MKGLIYYTPSNDDVADVLKEFTVDFLLKIYGSIVRDLYSQLITNASIVMDTSHFFWLITYFLKYTTQLELDFDLISPIFTYDIISYLVFQGVWLYEEFEIAYKAPIGDIKPTLRRLHLVS